MKLTYDPEADATYIYVVDRIADGDVQQTNPCEPNGINLRGEILRKAEAPATPGTVSKNR